MDDLIEYRTKKSIPEIFEDDGEEEFRRIETGILRELSEKPSRVVSTGGGVPVRQENREIMQIQRDHHPPHSITLRPSTERLTDTAEADNRTLRPLLGDNAPERRVANLLAERSRSLRMRRSIH